MNKNDKGAVSLGVLQRHGTRAVDLLKKLKAKDETLFTQTLCDPLFEDIDKAGISPWNDTQKQQFQTLMKKSQFQKVMKDIIKQDTTQYLSTLNKRGIKDPQALLTFGRIYNAGPQFAKRIFNTMQQEGKNVNDYEQVIESFRATEY